MAGIGYARYGSMRARGPGPAQAHPGSSAVMARATGSNTTMNPGGRKPGVHYGMDAGRRVPTPNEGPSAAMGGGASAIDAEAEARRQAWYDLVMTDKPIPSLVGARDDLAEDPNFQDWWYNNPKGFMKNPDVWQPHLESTLGSGNQLPLRFRDFGGGQPVEDQLPGISGDELIARLQAENAQFWNDAKNELMSYGGGGVSPTSEGNGLSPEILALLMQLGGNQEEDVPSYYYGPY